MARARSVLFAAIVTLSGCAGGPDPEPPLPPPDLPAAACGMPGYDLLPALGEPISFDRIDAFDLPASELDIMVSLSGFASLTPVPHGVQLFRFRYTTQDRGDRDDRTAEARSGGARRTLAGGPGVARLRRRLRSLRPVGVLPDRADADRPPRSQRVRHHRARLHRHERPRRRLHRPARTAAGGTGRDRSLGRDARRAQPAGRRARPATPGRAPRRPGDLGRLAGRPRRVLRRCTRGT